MGASFRVSAWGCVDQEQVADGTPFEQGLHRSRSGRQAQAVASGASTSQAVLDFFNLYSFGAIVLSEWHAPRAGALQHSWAGRKVRAAVQRGLDSSTAGLDVTSA